MKKNEPTQTKIEDLTHDTVPATVGMVKKVRDELRADIRSVDHKIDALDHKVASLDHKVASLDHKVASLDHKVASLDHKVASIDQKVESLRSEISSARSEMKSKFEELIASAHRSEVLMEEQRSENRIVLDGIKFLTDRQTRLETEIAELRQ